MKQQVPITNNISKGLDSRPQTIVVDDVAIVDDKMLSTIKNQVCDKSCRRRT